MGGGRGDSVRLPQCKQCVLLLLAVTAGEFSQAFFGVDPLLDSSRGKEGWWEEEMRERQEEGRQWRGKAGEGKENARAIVDGIAFSMQRSSTHQQLEQKNNKQQQQQLQSRLLFASSSCLEYSQYSKDGRKQQQ